MRTERELKESTKAKISQGMKKHHATRTEAQKVRTRERQSKSMKSYWATIPFGHTIGSATRTTLPCEPTKNE